MADFKVDVPRASVRRAARSSHQTRGTIGVHAKGGSWLANGSADGLVEIEIDPPCHTERSLSSLFRRMKVTELIVSLVDPDGFIAAVQRDGVHPPTGSRKE
jgi:predicted metal-dependent phosphotriesterase family hydrolase